MAVPASEAASTRTFISWRQAAFIGVGSMVGAGMAAPAAPFVGPLLDRGVVRVLSVVRLGVAAGAAAFNPEDSVLVFIFHHKPKLHVQFLGTPREGKNFLRLGRHVFNFCA